MLTPNSIESDSFHIHQMNTQRKTSISIKKQAQEIILHMRIYYTGRIYFSRMNEAKKKRSLAFLIQIRPKTWTMGAYKLLYNIMALKKESC